jgi:uncharacterized protein YcbX
MAEEVDQRLLTPEEMVTLSVVESHTIPADRAFLLATADGHENARPDHPALDAEDLARGRPLRRLPVSDILLIAAVPAAVWVAWWWGQ